MWIRWEGNNPTPALETDLSEAQQELMENGEDTLRLDTRKTIIFQILNREKKTLYPMY